METRTNEVFIVETGLAETLNCYDVINDMKESGKPVVWKNHGEYRFAPVLVLSEAIRLYEQWLESNKRMPGVYTFNGILHWDDCTVLDDKTVKLLLGEDSPECSYDTGSDDTQS